MKKGLLTIFFSVVALVSFGQGAIQTFNSEVIGRFTFANINNPSPSGVTTTPCTGYSDFSIGNNSISDGNLTNAEYIAGVTPGGTYTFEIKGDDCISGWGSIPSNPSIKRAAKVWIDMNNDGDLMDAGDLVYATPLLSYSTLTAPTFYGTVTMPLSLSPGDTLDMRVMYCRIQTLPTMFTFPYITSTSAYYHGETEDYSIIVEGFIDTVETTDLSCYGADDGAITITPMSSAPSGTQYSINGLAGPWSSTLIYTGLASGTYDVWARDLSSGIYEQYPHTVVVAEPLPLLASAFVSDSISCNGSSDGEITYNAAGGTAPYAFSIDTVNYVYGYSSPYTNTALSSGTYYVSIQDTNGCTVIDTVVLTDPPALSASVSLDSAVSCFGGSDGVVTISAVGGTPPYQYAFDNSAFSSDSVFNNISAGTYDIDVSDANGCQFTLASAITISQPTQLSLASATITSNYNGEDVRCVGDSNAIVDITASGGTPFAGGEYIYNLGSFVDTGASPFTFNGLSAGTFDIIIEDSNGCMTPAGVSTLTINNPTPLSITGASVVTGISCYGYTDGEVDITATGGTGTILYSVDSGATYSISNNFAALDSGMHYIYISDDNGCEEGPDSVYLASPPSFTLDSVNVTSDYNGQNISCNGASDGELTVYASGGTLPYDISLDDGVTFILTGVTSPQVFSGLSDGTYDVVVQDANGCNTTTTTVTLTEPALLTLSHSSLNYYNGFDVSCFGADDGGIALSSTGGTTPYQFSIGSGYVSGSIFNDLTAGTYTVSVQDTNGCSLSLLSSITLYEPTEVQITGLLVTSNYNGSDVACVGDSTGEISILTGGGSPFTNGYLLTIDGVFIDTITSPFVMDSLWAADYEVLIQDSIGCYSDTSIATISNPDTLTIDSAIVSGAISCFGLSDGEITIAASGGSGALQYSITGGAPYSSLATFTGLSAGTYDVVIIDANQCFEGIDTITLQDPPKLVLDSAAVTSDYNGSQTSCWNSSDGEITTYVSGGMQPYSYSITGGAPYFPVGSVQSNFPAGIYFVAVQDANGCESFVDTVTVTSPSSIIAQDSISSNHNGSDVSCFGASDGEVTITVSGGTGSIYDVDFGTTPFSGTSPIVASSLSAGNYNITVTDENGCQTVIATSLTNPAPLSVTTTQIDAGCDGATDGVAWATPSGGTPGYTYVWSDGQTDSAAINLEFGNYVVTVTDTNACSATTWVTISEPYITTSAENVLCYGSTVGIISAQVLNGNNSYTYLWSNGQTTATATGLGAGIYTVSATDPFGCVLTATDSISQPEELVVNILHTPICEIGEVSEIEAEVDGGVLPYDFTWNTTEITPVIYHPGGAYSVNVVDANGCLAFKSASVLGYSPLMISTYTQDASCFDNDDGLALVNVVGGLSPYTYQWSNGVTDSLNNQLTSGDHYLEVSDAQGCSESFVVTIFADESTCLNPYSAFTPNGDQNNDYWVIDNIELYPDALVEVFNRWGDRVYASKRYTNSWSGGWKGEYNGEVLPSATYYYVITLNNHEEPYKGTITIVR